MCQANQHSLFPGVPLPAINPSSEGIAYCNCHKCDTEIAKAASLIVYNELYCNNCAMRCERCGTVELEESDCIHRTDNSEELRCEDCAFQCADCNNWFRLEQTDHRNSSGCRICNCCRTEYVTCVECRSVIHAEDNIGSRNSALCQDCSEVACEDEEPEDRENESIFDHDYKPHIIYFRSLIDNKVVIDRVFDPKTLYFGVELEVEGGKDAAEDVNSEFLYCKDDGSLDNGFEIVSYPATLPYWRQSKDIPFKDLIRQCYRSYDTTTCGMHIHVSRSALTELDILKLLRFFRDNPKFILWVSRRKSILHLEEYAGITTGTQAHLLRKAKRRHLTEGNCSGYGGSRYCALNTRNSQTLEFRLFRGTLKEESFRRNLEFVNSLIGFVKGTNLYYMQASEFLAYVARTAVIATPTWDLSLWLQKYNINTLEIPADEEVS